LRIAVIHHANQTGNWYLIGDFSRAFQAAGHQVVHLRGPYRRGEADVALLHVDLSVVPSEYLALAAHYPVLLNGGIPDIRKRTVSQARLLPTDAYDGPVIVKTDLNHGGVPERLLHAPPGREPRFVRGAIDYPIFPSLEAVPAAFRHNPALVIERFLPEREGASYCLRQAFFLGDRHLSWRVRSDQPIIRGDNIKEDAEIPTPPALLHYRMEIGLDYGKIDFVEHGGRIVVLDVNKTIGGAGTAPETVARLAPGIVSATLAEKKGWRL
jgi:hypothetical protein